MDFRILEVDGSLANPLVVGAVMIWAAVLASVAVIVAKRAARGRSATPALVIGAVLTAATPVAQKVLATILYSAASLHLVGVAFWGGPPLCPAPIVALMPL